jgi:rod shape-determining protein MreD
MTKYTVLRRLTFLLEILAVFVLQETPGLVPLLGNAKPVAVIPAVLSMAMFEEETPATLLGLFGGLLIDFGYGSMLGFHGLLLAAVCHGVSRMAADLVRTNLLTAMILSASVSAALTLLQWACFYVLPGYRDAGYALTQHYLPIFLYTVALTPLAYSFNRALATQIRERED